MSPDNRSSGGDLSRQSPTGGSITPPPRPEASLVAEPRQDQTAAADLIRQKINHLYGDNVVVNQTETTSNQTPDNSRTDYQQSASNPYQRSIQTHPKPEAEQWQAYHSAWQNYYQEYYKKFYAQQKLTERPTGPLGTVQTQPDTISDNQSKPDYSRDDALYALRQELRQKVTHSATKIRRSRHFVPIAAAVAVVSVFLFLQYNQVLISAVHAYASPGAVNPQNIVIDPGTEAVVGMEPRLIIPKINVDVPVLYDVGVDQASQLAAMQKGVAHFPIPGANSHPGEIGNTVLSGHSSNDLFDPGEYKFIFAQLEKLAVGDSIYANYEGKRYTYIITRTEVVKPTEVNKLVYPTDKPVMTLITCTPLGTALNRLLVTAEQVSPDPTKATAAPSGSGEASGNITPIPGNSATLLERLFGRD